jgi:hypothetical protein
MSLEPTDGTGRKSTVCGLNGLALSRLASGCPPFKSSTRLGELRGSCTCCLFPWGALLRFAFGRKNMSQHIFPFESELQNSSQEAAPSSPSLSPTVSEKLALYGSSALSGLEHLTLLVGKEEIASALIGHFGSMKALSRASLQQLRQFLPRRKAEAVLAAFSEE